MQHAAGVPSIWRSHVPCCTAHGRHGTIPVFDPDDLGGIATAWHEGGGLVVRQVLATAAVAALLQDVRASAGDPEPGGTARDLVFAEHAPALLCLLAHQPFLRVARTLVGAPEIVVHRAAALVRAAGSPQVDWHTDLDTGSGPPTTIDGVLNRGDAPSLWFYLTGCRPDQGGLWLIPGSHRPQWQPLPPYRLSEDRRLILTQAGTPAPIAIPGAVAVHAEPGDLVAFAARTYHAASPLTEGLRLSAGFSLRARRVRCPAPWPLSATTRGWLAQLPTAVRPYFEGYVGLDPSWRFDPPVPAAAARR